MKLLWAVIFVPAVWAVNPEIGLRQYNHTSWTQEEGTPLPPVVSLAQTRDGYLWLGTESNGMFRSDGARFAEWKPISGALPEGELYRLVADPDGGLWVGTLHGVGKIVQDRVTRLKAVDELPCHGGRTLLHDPVRGWWLLSQCWQRTVLALIGTDGSVRTFGAEAGISDNLSSLVWTRNGDLWMTGANGICRWTPGSKPECSPVPSWQDSILLEDLQGSLLLVDMQRRQIFAFANGKLEPLIAPIANASFDRSGVLQDRDGNIWIGTRGQGLLRIRRGKVDRFTTEEGLSSNMVYALLEDSEGDLWVGTARGVDRIRDPKFTRVSSRDGMSGDLLTTVYAGRSGVWAGTAGTGLNLVQSGQIGHPDSHPLRPRATVNALYEDAGGQLWTGTSAGVVMHSGAKLTEILTPEGQRVPRVFNIGGDANGSVWLLNDGGPLYQVRGSTAYVYTAPSLELVKPYRMLVTRGGEVWLGSYDGGITVVAKYGVRHYGAAEGLAGGHVQALHEDTSGIIWAGTAEGLTRFENGRLTTWAKTSSVVDGGVFGIADDARGDMWLMSATELVRVERATLKAGGQPRRQRFGRADGLRLYGVASPTPAIARDRGGHIWVCTQDGAAVFDPERLRRNPLPPPLTIEQVTVDGKSLDTTSHEVWFPGRTVQIAYTAVSLNSPELVRFRYRLIGVDPNWVDAGSRRNVAYAHLSPGGYRFRVTAANNDGPWNENVAEMVLYVEPYFYETYWFRAAVASAVLLMCWAAYRIRVRTLQSRWELIAAERAKFSRELHDSLLQGFSGVVFLLEAAAKKFDSAPEKSRKDLMKALDRADNSLREARQLVTDLRIPALENSTLPQALRETSHQMVHGMPVHFEFEVHGSAKPAHYDVDANLFLIGREALSNSLSHAGANRIRMELQYTSKGLGLTVEDDGSGFDPEMARAKEGHQGFRGMEERAKNIGGALAVESAGGKGTKIVVRVPWK